MNSGEEPSSKFTQTNVGANGEFRSSKYFIRISAVEIHKGMQVDQKNLAKNYTVHKYFKCEALRLLIMHMVFVYWNTSKM